MNRICIHTADVIALTGQSESTARRLVRRVRKELGKHRLDPITIREFCSVTRMNEEEVREAIFGIPKQLEYA
ncbi:MAG: hypothetical protein HC880_00330 [Bacteroidia bacterium]|nr:hypothetical protein [Bacteroidia bacterium]